MANNHSKSRSGRHPLPESVPRKFAVGITLDQETLDNLVVIQTAHGLSDRSSTLRWLVHRERARLDHLSHHRENNEHA